VSTAACLEFRKWIATPLEQLIASHVSHGGNAVLGALQWVRGAVRSERLDGGVARAWTSAVLRGLSKPKHHPSLLRPVLALIADAARV